MSKSAYLHAWHAHRNGVNDIREFEYAYLRRNEKMEDELRYGCSGAACHHSFLQLHRSLNLRIGMRPCGAAGKLDFWAHIARRPARDIYVELRPFALLPAGLMKCFCRNTGAMKVADDARNRRPSSITSAYPHDAAVITFASLIASFRSH